MEFNANFSMQDTLKVFKHNQKLVTLTLEFSGKTYQGIVKEVGNHAVVISLQGEQSLSDAMIKFSSISTIETQIRE